MSNKLPSRDDAYLVSRQFRLATEPVSGEWSRIIGDLLDAVASGRYVDRSAIDIGAVETWLYGIIDRRDERLASHGTWVLPKDWFDTLAAALGDNR